MLGMQSVFARNPASCCVVHINHNKCTLEKSEGVQRDIKLNPLIEISRKISLHTLKIITVSNYCGKIY